MEIFELDPAEIVIGPRFRKSFPNVDALAESIMSHGQMQPIGVFKNSQGKWELVFGHRRLMACKKIGYKVRCVETEVINDLDQQLKEFLENSNREDFSPAEKAAAVKNLHEQLMLKHKDKPKPWSVEKTAKALGLTRQYVSDLLRIAKAIETQDLSPEKARNLTLSQLKSITSTKDRAKKLLSSVTKAEAAKLKGKIDFQFLQGDCFDFKSLGIEPNSFHIMLTDPPYGVEYKTKDPNTAASNFDDSIQNLSEDFIDKFWTLADSLIIKNTGLVIAFCSLEQFFLHKIKAAEHNFPEIYPHPIVWLKASAGQPWNNKHFPVHCYEVAILARRDKEPLFALGHADWFSAPRPTSNRIHPTEKPVSLAVQILKAFSFPHYTFIDPFAGSGSFLLAAYKQGLPKVYGIELNQTTYAKAKQRINDTLGLSK